MGWDLRLPPWSRQKGVRVHGVGPESGAARDLAGEDSSLCPWACENQSPDKASLDMGRRGYNKGGDPESSTDESCPQGAREHGRDRWQQGRWDPGRNGRKVLLDGGQLQVRCSRGWAIRTRRFCQSLRGGWDSCREGLSEERGRSEGTGERRGLDENRRSMGTGPRKGTETWWGKGLNKWIEAQEGCSGEKGLNEGKGL